MAAAMPADAPFRTLPPWSWIAPAIAWGVVATAYFGGYSTGIWAVVLLAALIGAVLASVHHAEVIAHRLGEPFGTLVLAVAVTVVELSLILTLMLAGGEEAYALARDSVFAAFMISTTGIIGLCLLIGGIRYGEAPFQSRGASAALSVLASLAVLTLVLPNFTLGASGPIFTRVQLGFVAAVSLTLYLIFVFVQTVRHRNYFLVLADGELTDEVIAAHRPTVAATARALLLLLAGLIAVVLLAKALATTLDQAVAAVGAPRAAAGAAIAALVMLPEGMSAVRAARRNQLQTSLNLALGSALAGIGLTIPSVALAAELFDEPLILGIGPDGMVLMLLTLLVSSLTLATGRSTVLQGAVHLTIFATFLLLTFSP